MILEEIGSLLHTVIFDFVEISWGLDVGWTWAVITFVFWEQFKEESNTLAKILSPELGIKVMELLGETEPWETPLTKNS